MVALSSQPSLSVQAQEEFQTTAARIQSKAAALRLWEWVLTDAERQRLGGDLAAAWCRLGTVGMWQRLRGVSVVRAVADVGLELGLIDERRHRWLLRAAGEVHDDAEAAIQQAVASGGLVLVERPRAVYWNCEAVPVDWDRHGALWDYFWELCRHAKAGRPIDQMTFPAAADPAVVTKYRHRLVAQRNFPRSLAARIQPAGRHAQKLQLSPDQVRLFELVFGETVKERTT
jgi:hypothetical protein